MLNKYHLPTEIYFGEGCINELKDIVRKGNKILLVTGRNFLKKSGWLKRILGILEGNKISLFDRVFENPDVELIEEGLFIARKQKVDIIIAIGGGSVLDCAKAIAVLAKNSGRVIDYLDKKKKVTKPGIKFIAIPTTAGSASEVTPYSVITVPKRGIKITLADTLLYPDIALIDPDFLKSLPGSHIANPGIDVLCHAIEAFWNINHNPITDSYALKAIRLVFGSLAPFYRNPSSCIHRTNMAWASLFAGLAFSNTRTTACHSISYPLTTMFGIPHGQACVITLPEVLIYNSKTSKRRILDIAAAIGAKSPVEAAEGIRKLIKSIGLKVKLSDFGLTEMDLSVVMSKGFTPERMVNNPRKISKQNMLNILRRIL